MQRRIVITGLGVISAIGENVEQFWQALQDGRSGVQPLFGLPHDLLQMRVGAQVRNFNPSEYFEVKKLHLLDRFSQFAVVASRQATANASLTERDKRESAAIIGTGVGGMLGAEDTHIRLYKEGKKRAHPLTIPKVMYNAAASQVSIDLGVQGPVFSTVSACASASHAICQAALLLRSGIVNVALAGGTESPFVYSLLKSWEAMRVLAKSECRPFSIDRDGLVLGEGAGILVLESLEHAQERGARIYAELAGFGMSADAGHITDPSEIGAARAITSALEDSGMQTNEVDYINAHGTGTRANDLTETQAIHSVFGDYAKKLLISSTKPMHGHALGASGALEAIATIMAINDSVVPPTINFSKAGEGCDLDYVPNQMRHARVNTAISNSFAFGGLNSVLVFRQYNGD